MNHFNIPKAIFISLLALILSHISLAQNLSFEWAKPIGGTNFDEGYSITIDNSDNVYTTGYFRGTVDFDPGAGTTNLTSAGYDDIFIQKLDSSGNLLWVKQFGGTNLDKGYSITTDNYGNVYTAGVFRDTVDFDPGTGTTNLTSAGYDDIFIQKLDSLGNFLWVKQMGGIVDDFIRSITIDNSGNIYTTGNFYGTLDFDPGTGTTNLISVGSRDIFIQKLDSSGNFLWAKNMGGIDWDEGFSITTNNSGNVYTTGTFQGTVDFNPGAGTTNLTSAGGMDVFIQKLDSSGNLLWVKKMGGTGNDGGRFITTDNNDNVYTTGSFTNTADFDPGIGTTNLTSVGGNDIFIQKLNSSGNLLWAKSMGGNSSDVGYSITTDSGDNIYTTGLFNGSVDFDPGTGTTILTSAGWWDIFIQKLDSSGNLLLVKQMGGTGWDVGYSITTDDNDNIYTTGFFWVTVDFDPGTGITNLTSAGIRDIFIHKLSQCTPTNSSINITACDSFYWADDSTTYTISGVYNATIANTANCDSTITLNLTINNSSTGTDIITACDSIIWIDSNTYTASNNTATHTLTNAQSCDSVVTLNLTIKYSNTGTDIITACDSFIWIDGNTYKTNNSTATHTLTNSQACDSIVTLNLTINYSNTGIDTISACKTYTWIDGITYTANNNTATHTLTNSGGCDSIVTLNLTIDTVDVSLTTTDPSIMANASGASYQWLDCNNNYSIIPGATSQSYTATANGDYAVEITQNSCVDTSLCVTISTVSISENPVFKGVSIYPNPTQDIVNINLGNLRDVSVKVFNVHNQLIYHKENINTPIYKFVLKEAPGVYFIELNANGEKQQYKLIKGL